MRRTPTPWWPFLGHGISLAAMVLLSAGCTTNLNKAATSDHPEKVDRFLAAGSNINETDQHGATPLINAAQSGNFAIIKKLVDHGANVNAVDHEGYSALMRLAASDDYHNDAVAYLLDHGARTDLWSAEGETALLLAAKRDCDPEQAANQARLVSLLLSSGANPSEDTRMGEHPLHVAARVGQPEGVLELLLQATPAPAQLDRRGYNALSAAARGDQRKTEEFLVGQGLKPQRLDPVPPGALLGMAQIDLSFPITARACDAYGDFLLARGAAGAALESYRQSAGAYTAAMDEYQGAVERFSAALKQQKDARTKRIVDHVLINALGVGLAVTTGVGFLTLPKHVANDINELSDELDRVQDELKSLKAEYALLTPKLARALALPAAPPASAGGS
jgi:ankyrin repeat protein